MDDNALERTPFNMDLSGLGPQEQTLEGFSRHLNAVMSATEQATIWSLTCQFFRDLGFAHAIYGYSPDSHGAQLGAPEDYLVLSTFDAEVSAAVVNQELYKESLTFQWALQNAGVASWSMSAEDCGADPDYKVNPAALDFFVRHNLLTGCTIGFPKERSRGNAVMGLIGPPGKSQHAIDALLEKSRDVIYVAAACAHRCMSVLPYPMQRGSLTARQREVLEWVAEGKTSADIAAIMGITAPTVDKHLRLARETLGVDTTAHALIKAAFLNQVFHRQITPTNAALKSNNGNG